MIIGMGLGMVDRDIEVGKEYKVGTFTINGVTYNRYVKVVDCVQLPNAGSQDYPHGISGIAGVLGIYGATYSSGSTVHNPMPLVHNSDVTAQMRVFISAANITIRTASDWSAHNALITIEYYK